MRCSVWEGYLNNIDQQLREFLHAKLPRVAADIEALFRNSIRITTNAVDDEGALPVGSSKLGGTPDLPPDVAWPEWKGKPLAFIAQINLGDTAALDTDDLLPKTGLLSFFYEATDTPWGFDPKDRGSAVVLYIENEVRDLELATRPEDMPEYSVFKACALERSTEVAVPDRESHYIEELQLSPSPKRNRRSDTTGTEIALSDRPDSAKGEVDFYDELQMLIWDSYNEPIHKILGHSDNIQGSMELECQLVTNGIYCGDVRGYRSKQAKALAPMCGDWILLLQVDTDDNAEMMWGDSGRIYYWIRKQDLAKRDFSNIWLILQCY